MEFGIHGAAIGGFIILEAFDAVYVMLLAQAAPTLLVVSRRYSPKNCFGAPGATRMVLLLCSSKLTEVQIQRPACFFALVVRWYLPRQNSMSEQRYSEPDRQLAAIMSPMMGLIERISGMRSDTALQQVMGVSPIYGRGSIWCP